MAYEIFAAGADRKQPALLPGLIASALLALLLATAMVLPDHLATSLGMNNRAVYSAEVYAAVYVFALLLALVPGRVFVISILSIAGLFELIHFCYMAYFGGVIDANVMTHGIDELADVVEAALGVTGVLLFAPLIVVLPYALAIIIFGFAAAARRTLAYASVVVLAVIAIVPYKIVQTDDPVKYFPIDIYPSVANSYLTFSVLLTNAVAALSINDTAAETVHFAAAKVVETGPPGPITVVLVMSESLTPARMSLFGFSRPTTPLLESLVDLENFVYTEGIAAGIGTLSSFHSFWNGVRDPRDAERFATQGTNLFRLAQAHGFHTQMFSAQGMNLLRGAGTRYIDKLVTQDTAKADYVALHDEMLLKYAGEVRLDERNLIVFHQRSAHGPYAHNYRLQPELAMFPTEDLEYADFQRNAYDNAVRYNDMIIYRLLNIMRERVAGPLLIVVTADHGQLLGENPQGLFGHGQLLPAAARVPMLFYFHDLIPAFESTIRNLASPTHYELGLLLIRAFGFEIDDPNAEPGVFYINGSGRFGKHGYIRVVKDAANKGPPQFEIIPSA